MANPEHLKILNEGSLVWNKWRDENNLIHPDLRGANLAKSDLSGMNLQEVDLGEANLSEVKLLFADLRKANLKEACLSLAHISGTNLTMADLTMVDLRGTELFQVELQETNFNNAYFMTTKILSCITLSEAKNLDTVKHISRASLDVITLRSCVSGVPYSFLQGVGYTNEEIEILKAQYSTPIKYYSCFISYSSKDAEFAKDLHSKLRDANITVWFAPEDFKIGDKIRDRINEQIRIYDKLLIVLSENSVKSSWVKYEVETALNREIKENKTILFPIRLDDSIFDINESWAIDIQSRHIGDFRNWENRKEYQKSLERLIKDLKADQK